MPYMYTTKHVYKHVIHVQDKHTDSYTNTHTLNENKLKKRSEKRDWLVQQLCIPKGVTGSRDKASGDNLKSPALQVLLGMPALCLVVL